MTTRAEAEALFGVVFDTEQAIWKLFNAEKAAHWDYDLTDERDAVWAIVMGDHIVYDSEVPEEWCEDDEEEGWMYSGHMRGGFFPGEHFSLAFVDLQTGHSGAAMILDNSKRVTPPWEKTDA